MLYLFLADGFEDTEAIVPLDCIRRAGIRILTVGLNGSSAVSSHGVKVSTDIGINEVDLTSCDGIILPGGMPGTKNLYESKEVCEIVKFCDQNDKMIASICAAPSIPGRLGILAGKKAVCFPGFEKYLTGAIPSDRFAETDGHFITARGAGCAFLFAKAIITYLTDEQKANDVLTGMQYSDL